MKNLLLISKRLLLALSADVFGLKQPGKNCYEIGILYICTGYSLTIH